MGRVALAIGVFLVLLVFATLGYSVIAAPNIFIEALLTHTHALLALMTTVVLDAITTYVVVCRMGYKEANESFITRFLMRRVGSLWPFAYAPIELTMVYTIYCVLYTTRIVLESPLPAELVVIGVGILVVIYNMIPIVGKLIEKLREKKGKLNLLN